eukprot:1148983-Amphidinium_carterae.1
MNLLYDQFARLTALSTASPELMKWARENHVEEIPCRMVFTRKPLSSAQNKEAQSQGKKYALLAYKPKSPTVVRGNLQSYTFHDTNATNADASLLRAILSL